MKLYIKAYDNHQLKVLKEDPNWVSPVRYGLTPYENPISYVGNTKARKLGNKFNGLFDNHILDCMPVSKEVINISELKTLQPFLVEDGLGSNHEYSNDPFCIRYGGQLYLINGNHRVAKALLDGKTTYNLLVYDLDKYLM